MKLRKRKKTGWFWAIDNEGKVMWGKDGNGVRYEPWSFDKALQRGVNRSRCYSYEHVCRLEDNHKLVWCEVK